MKQTLLKYVITLLFSFILIIGAISCSAKQPKPDVEPEPVVEVPADVQHVVKYHGETLGLIALWYTGDVNNWTHVRDANPELRPEKINLNQIIVIPGHLVVQYEPLPKRIVKSPPREDETKDKSEEDEGSAVSDSLEVGQVMSPDAVAQEKEVSEDSSQKEEPNVEAKNDDIADDVVAKPREDKKVVSEEDLERERLLEELLQQ